MQLIYMFLFLSLDLVMGELTATSTHQMRRVLEGEDDLLRDFRIYIDVVEQKLQEIRLILNEAEQREQEALLDPEAFVSNPLNSFPMLRRMHKDANSFYHYLKEEEGKDLQQIADYKLEVLTDLDLEHAAQGLLRIQEVYNLDERDMAKGILSQKQYNANLSTLDCVYLARYLRKQEEIKDAAKWLEIALEQYEKTPESVLQLMNTERAVILKELGQIQLQRGNWESLNQVYKHSEHKQEAEAFMQLAQQHLTHLSNCRGQSRLPVSPSIRCHYNAINTPSLQLAPLKQEQLSLDPHIVLYHDVISFFGDISNILRLTKPFLKRSLVGAGRSDIGRNAMSAPIAQNSSLSAQRIYRSIRDISGLEFSSRKQLELINYGLGGQYYLHYDCAYNSQEHKLEGERFATVLLYLTDVQSGGLTSFPKLQLAVQPVKGSALLWHNVNNAAECDRRMLHAACPVLQGNRWVAAQWFETAAQKSLVCRK